MAQADIVKKPALARRTVQTLLEPRVFAPVIAMLVLSVLVIIPLATMVIAAFRPADVLPLSAGGWTTENFVSAYTGGDLWPIIKNTIIYAGGGVLFALPLAFAFAFLTERTDMPFRNSMYTLMFIPMSTPVFATSLGWVLLLGPKAGTINQYIRIITGSDAITGPINIFTMGGLIFVHVLGVVPSMWLFLISVLRNMDPALEEAAATAGSSKWRIMRRITIPLMLPGVTAVFIYFFISGIESLEHPLALGPTAGIETLSTKIFFTLLPTADAGRNYGIPAAIGMLGLALGLIGMGAYLYMVRRASSYAVVAGKGFRPRTLRLGNWKWVAVGFVGLYMAIKVVLPFGMLIYASLLKFYMPPVPRLFDKLVWTTNNYERLLDYRFFGRYFVNSFVVAIMAAFITMLLVSFISWMVVRYPSPLTRLVNILAFMPLAIPGVISTIAFFLLFIGTPLYGTLLLLALAFVARYLAFGTRLMHSAQLQIHKELEEAAMVSGVGVAKTFFLINLRLLIPAFANGFLWVLVHAAKDFSVALLLASSGTLLIGNIFYGAFTGGRYPEASSMMVVLIIFNLVLVFAGRRWISKALKG